MSPKFLALATLALGLAAPLVGCGEEKMERGLAAPQEQANPINPAEERMTEEQRRQLETKEDDAAAQRDFDGGGGEEETNTPD
jgi:hypothetical protein